jgi:signal transduction histidine kinase/putative methionine-R-sulfoxide reductase with GAF domain
VAASVLDVYAENLQAADCVDRVVELIRQAVDAQSCIGVGAIFLVDEKNEPKLAARVRGPASADLTAPEIDLAGMARRAVREGETVRQSGVSAGLLWAVPLRSPVGIEGVVAAVGELGDLPRLLAHGGLALAREHRREERERTWREAESRAANLERAAGILDCIARDGGTDAVLRLIAAASSGVAGIGATSIWALRADDEAYVEVARANGGAPADEPREPRLPVEARCARTLHDWASGLPRWKTCSWIPSGTIERLRPDPGDRVLVMLEGREGQLPLGFVLAEVNARPPEGPHVEDLQRWAALGRLALENRSDDNRSLRDLERLREEQERLAELHRMKSQFIAAVSHELRTPLTSITAYAETLRSRNITIEDELRGRFLRVIHEESRRLTRIVDGILDLATMEAGRVRLSCRTIDLREVIEGALDVIRPIAKEKNVSVTSPPLESIQVHADPDLLKQLTVNLLDNAVRLSPKGGSVGLELEGEDTTVRFAVRDDGPGIPADRLDAIFERFYRMDSPGARRPAGSGLGLAICKSIVAWHDGRIWAESEDGRGARFVVSLPKIRATSRSRAQKPILKEHEPQGHRIPELLVEMISEVMSARTVSLMLLDETGGELFIQAAMGLPDEAIRDARVAVGDRIAGRVAKSGATLFIPDLDADDRFDPGPSDRYETRSLISVPVRLNEDTIGVINVANKTSARSFNEHDRRLLDMVSQRVALVLGKLRESGGSRQQLDQMESAIRGVIDVRRHYYSNREEYSRIIRDVCRVLEIDEEHAAHIHYASILRDVGMTLLPEGVYKKPTELSDEDREKIRRHPEEGAKVLRPIEFLTDVFDIILSHHEEPDGTGYPRGVKGNGIPIGARILAVVDAYHSMRSDRPYREPVSPREAIDEIRRNAGEQFDERVVDALVEVLGENESMEPKRGTENPESANGAREIDRSEEEGHLKHEGMV